MTWPDRRTHPSSSETPSPRKDDGLFTGTSRQALLIGMIEKLNALGPHLICNSFKLENVLVRAGSAVTLECRRGTPSCEINWLDPEPSRESDDYEAYMEELQRIPRRSDFYRGYLIYTSQYVGVPSSLRRRIALKLKASVRIAAMIYEFANGCVLSLF